MVVSGTFAGINWGNGTKWLKTEIDIAGGNNYVVMGNSQFMSTPYAFYADRSGFSSGSFTIPDGFDNAATISIPNNANYTVPAGKNLYIPAAEYPMTIDGDTLFTNFFGNGANAKTFAGASENSVVNLNVRNNNALPLAGFIVDKKVEWKTFNLANMAFTVPAGKQFVIVNMATNFGGHGTTSHPITYPNPYTPDCTFTINGTSTYLLSNTILEPGTVLSVTCSSLPVSDYYFTVNGYFMNR